jgi:hypothetical protein
MTFLATERKVRTRRASRSRATYQPSPTQIIPVDGSLKVATSVPARAQTSDSTNRAHLLLPAVSAPYTQKVIVLDTLMVSIVFHIVGVQRLMMHTLVLGLGVL